MLKNMRKKKLKKTWKTFWEIISKLLKEKYLNHLIKVKLNHFQHLKKELQD